ncbi:MAG: 3-hydroxyacyl-CoA dehydrogenase NAD-binding domain-containing protein [Terracidiphilus sp.]
MPETVAIIGAGPLGRWLALAAARAGFSVLLEDVMPANLHHAQEWLRLELGEGLSPQKPSDPSTDPNTGPSTPLRSAQDDSAMGVTFVSTIEDAVREADLAIDCVPDELESKLEILWLLDRMAPPRTVLATPTTRLSIDDLANCTYRPDKCIAIVAEACELTGNAGADDRCREILLRITAKTSRESAELLERFWKRLGFLPVFANVNKRPCPANA